MFAVESRPSFCRLGTRTLGPRLTSSGRWCGALPGMRPNGCRRGSPAMHLLVELQHLTRKEFLRGLQGVSDEDARKRVEPMNSIGWIIGHMACQEHAFFVAL